MERLFGFLFIHNEFFYTLVGIKPLSFCTEARIHGSFPQDIKSIIEDFYYQSYSKNLSKEWEAWKKHAFLFSNDNIFLVEDPVLGPTIIHKKAFCEVVAKNRDVFDPVFGKFFDFSSFIQTVEKKSLLSIIGNNHFLMGILLGYGFYNAECFQKLIDLQQKSVVLNNISLENSVNTYRLDSFSHHIFPLSFTNRVEFAVDLSHQETIALKQSYIPYEELHDCIVQQNNWFFLMLTYFLDHS